VLFRQQVSEIFSALCTKIDSSVLLYLSKLSFFSAGSKYLSVTPFTSAVSLLFRDLTDNIALLPVPHQCAVVVPVYP
jgi:hypothetical protein